MPKDAAEEHSHRRGFPILGRQQTGSDGGMSFVCVPPSGCAQEGEKCTTAADCCGAQSGTQCIAGYCATLTAQ